MLQVSRRPSSDMKSRFYSTASLDGKAYCDSPDSADGGYLTSPYNYRRASVQETCKSVILDTLSSD